jgi:hypothetical protein
MDALGSSPCGRPGPCQLPQSQGVIGKLQAVAGCVLACSSARSQAAEACRRKLRPNSHHLGSCQTKAPKQPTSCPARLGERQQDGMPDGTNGSPLPVAEGHFHPSIPQVIVTRGTVGAQRHRTLAVHYLLAPLIPSWKVATDPRLLHFPEVGNSPLHGSLRGGEHGRRLLIPFWVPIWPLIARTRETSPSGIPPLVAGGGERGVHLSMAGCRGCSGPMRECLASHGVSVTWLLYL